MHAAKTRAIRRDALFAILRGAASSAQTLISFTLSEVPRVSSNVLLQIATNVRQAQLSAKSVQTDMPNISGTINAYSHPSKIAKSFSIFRCRNSFASNAPQD
jgi:hypothetical protein